MTPNARRVFVIGIIAVAVLAAVVVLVVVLNQDDDDDVTTTDTTSTTPTSEAEPTPTAETTTTQPTATPAPIPDELATAVWPWAGSEIRYTDPVEAARGFTVDYIGFVDPLVGEFQQGDSRSGEVEVRAVEGGPLTVVFVRQLTADDSWWVLGSAAENIVLTQPEALTQIDSPLTITGMARAFEGTVVVQIRADGQNEPLAESFGTASGDDTLGPFEVTFEWPNPGIGAGAVVLFTESPEDGRVLESSTTRVAFAAD